MNQLKIQPPGDQIFASMLIPPKELINEYIESPLAPQTRMDLLIWQGFSCGLHWLYKLRFNEGHKLPFSKDIKDLNRPLGELFNSALRLIEHFHSYENTHGFSHPLLRFKVTANELWLLYFDLGNGSKSLKAKTLRAVVRDLEDGHNPFDSVTQPNLLLLGNDIIRVAPNPNHSVACRELLRNTKGSNLGFFPVLRRLATRFEKNTALMPTWIDDKGIHQRKGSGRGVSTVSSATIQKWVGLESNSGKGFEP